MAISRGVNPEKIALTERSQNTFQEAKSIAEMLEKNETVALVTSAFHMYRAMNAFETQGLTPLAVPVDHMTETTLPSIINILPNSDALRKVSLFTRENIGRFYYSFKD